MEDKERTEYINQMLECIMESSHEMPDYVFNYFINSKVEANQKPFYDLIADSFLTLFAYCKLMREHAWSQAFALLRIGIEQVAAVFIMSNIPGSLKAYLNLCLEKAKFAKLDNTIEKKEYCKNRGISLNRINEYLDYSWVEDFTEDKSYGRKQMIKLARLDEFLVDIDETLNAFAHGSISVFQMSKDSWNLMKVYGRRACLTCCKLYDFLCCSYYNLIGDSEFQKLPLNKYFEIFKKIWRVYFIKEGWTK